MKNKKILGPVFFIVLILVVAPYFIGKMAQEKIENHASQITQMPGYTLKITDYDQGWFTSHATLSYGFDEHTLNILNKSADKDVEFDTQTINALQEGLVFDITIAHGPVTFQRGISFSLLTMSGALRDIDHESYRLFKEKAKISSLLDLFATISYGGTASITLHSPAFKADYSDISGKKMIIDYAGMDIDATINAAFDTYEAKAHINRLSITMEDGTVILHEVVTHSSGDRLNDYIWTGNGTASIGEFNVTGPKNATFSLRNFTSDYDFNKESDTALTLHWTSNAAAIETSDVKLKDFQLDMDMNHLDLEAVTDYVKSINETYGTMNGEAPTPEKTAANMQAIAARTGEKLIKGSPELIIHHLNFLMDDGFFKGDGIFSINGEGLENIQELSDPLTLNKRLAAVTNIKFNKAMAQALTAVGLKKQLAAGGMDISAMPKEQLDQMISIQTSAALQTFILQGYLQSEGDDYFAHFDMKDGKRLINGKPLAIPGL
ncbi:MAG: YdgA family protein [Emcibacter sp.]|nr:YdgA family protein [Emcibacter sp.]